MDDEGKLKTVCSELVVERWLLPLPDQLTLKGEAPVADPLKFNPDPAQIVYDADPASAVHCAVAVSEGKSHVQPNNIATAIREGSIQMDFIGSKVAGSAVRFLGKVQAVINRLTWTTQRQLAIADSSFRRICPIRSALLKTMKCPPSFTMIASLIGPIGIR